jgi:hypothetical protein
MELERQVKMSTSELACLWTSYMNDSMAVCIFTHFLQHIDDKEIEEAVQYALSLAEAHVGTISDIFRNEDIALPDGFNLQNDVDLSAPRLYSDTFYLFYLHNMAKIGGNSYTLALANSARSDVRKYFTECTESSAALYNKTAEISLTKGLFLRPPQMIMPKHVEYVQKQGFLAGWFVDRRPLSCIEIMNLFFNIERNEVGRSLVMGFSQGARTKEVVQYFVRGKEISSKHIEIFSSILTEADVPAPMTWDTMPTESTVPPFSEKLMMFHIAALTGAAISHYGTSIGSSPRRDIAVHYSRLTQEVALFAEDGANIMIQHHWMEQPPLTTDRDALTRI